MATTSSTTKKVPAAKKAPASKKAPAKKKAASKKKETGNPCWDGFTPVPGKTPGTKGSCKKKGS